MASPTFPLVSNGDHKQHQQHASHNKKQASRAGSPIGTGQSESAGAGGSMDDEADEAGSSANEAPNENVDETDVIALSGIQAALVTDSHGLAGHEGGDIAMFDTKQSTAGAAASDDEDDYAGVDDVSDDEEIETAGSHSIVRAAERDLIDEFRQQEKNEEALARSLGLGADGLPLEWHYDPNMNEDPFFGLDKEDPLREEMMADAATVLGWPESPELRGRQNSQDSAGSKKRVRFADGPHETFSRSSSVSSADAEEFDPNELYPDLLDAQDNPALRQRFGLDVDVDADFSDAGSCYDFDGEDERMALAIDDEESDSDEMSDSDDGSEYEGDTTDDEEEEIPQASRQPIPSPRQKPQTATPTPTPTPSRRSSVGTPRSAASPATPTGGRVGPKRGTFMIDHKKATLLTDAETKQLRIIPPREPAAKDKAFWERAQLAMRSRGGSRSSPFLKLRSGAGANTPPRPLTANSTLNNMFHGNLDILNGNDSESGFSSNMYTELQPRPLSSFTGSYDEDSEEEQADVNIGDFIDLDDDDSDADEPASASSIMSPQSDLCDSFSSLEPVRNDSLLSHLDQQRNLVGAFRHNQSFAKAFSSMASHPAKRASTSEANALQKGRRGAGNTPMTPARKKRVSQDLSLTGAGIRKAAASPLAGRRPRSRGSSISGMNQTLDQSLM